MTDKVIRISSEQGFAEAWLNANAPSTLNLCDFRIPRGMVVDLSKSYIAFNTQIKPTVAGNFTSTDDPINSNLRINGLDAADNGLEVPNAALIRNASISCDKGLIESIRRVDTLRSTLWNLEHDAEERKDDLNAFTGGMTESEFARANQLSGELGSTTSAPSTTASGADVSTSAAAEIEGGVTEGAEAAAGAGAAAGADAAVGAGEAVLGALDAIPFLDIFTLAAGAGLAAGAAARRPKPPPQFSAPIDAMQSGSAFQAGFGDI